MAKVELIFIDFRLIFVSFGGESIVWNDVCVQCDSDVFGDDLFVFQFKGKICFPFRCLFPTNHNLSFSGSQLINRDHSANCLGSMRSPNSSIIDAFVTQSAHWHGTGLNVVVFFFGCYSWPWPARHSSMRRIHNVSFTRNTRFTGAPKNTAISKWFKRSLRTLCCWSECR